TSRHTSFPRDWSSDVCSSDLSHDREDRPDAERDDRGPERQFDVHPERAEHVELSEELGNVREEAHSRLLRVHRADGETSAGPAAPGNAGMASPGVTEYVAQPQDSGDGGLRSGFGV